MRRCSPTCFLFKIQEEFLVEDERHAADLLHFGFRSGVPVDEVGCDGNRQLPPELLPFETWERGGGKKSTNVRKETVNQWESSLNIEDGTMLRSEQSFVGT